MISIAAIEIAVATREITLVIAVASRVISLVTKEKPLVKGIFPRHQHSINRLIDCCNLILNHRKYGGIGFCLIESYSLDVLGQV